MHLFSVYQDLKDSASLTADWLAWLARNGTYVRITARVRELFQALALKGKKEWKEKRLETTQLY